MSTNYDPDRDTMDTEEVPMVDIDTVPMRQSVYAKTVPELVDEAVEEALDRYVNLRLLDRTRRTLELVLQGLASRILEIAEDQTGSALK